MSPRDSLIPPGLSPGDTVGLMGKGVLVVQLLWAGTLVMPVGQEATAGGPGVTGPPRASALLGWGAGPGVSAAGHGDHRCVKGPSPQPPPGNPIPSVSELSEWDPEGSGQDPRWGPLWVPPGGAPLALYKQSSQDISLGQTTAKQ